ncbi:colanic acid biosynthesis glycosyltransferase WcaL [Mesobaculum littorinae]|uniref:Colanic acid biosynthesis glycosyltransferase WcaL n=1 Tax=Mesobaculum littorinae TaxID=2486419 RepID=A0A438AIJ8_9RHOB|nr:glycosyltransferase family 4 protein [Mesobaculum littorinae]RVV98468.1 colanic acid biosynthesis glycosyltransferase WcaL [Mesobaculum littorinae]
MKLAVLVTEFPKTTETFIQRDLMEFRRMGADLRIYHLTRWRHGQILHEFAAPLAAHARHVPLAGVQAARAALRHRGLAARLGATIARVQREDGRIAAKSLALTPAALAIGDELRAWGADHVHAEFAGHPATAAWIAHHVSGTPYSISCRAHDIFRSQRLLAEKFAAASAVRSVSDFARKFLVNRVPGVPDERIEVIHSSVDTARIRPLPAAPEGRFEILYVGSLQPRKGVPVLLDALDRMPRDADWRLTIAGDGPDRAALEAAARRFGPRVRFLGQQDFARVSELYRDAHVCVAPSIIGPGGRTEGIPNVMMEALAFARPAISTDVSGIPELIRDGDTGRLVPANDAAALAAALEDIRRDPVAARAMALRGRALVEAEYDLARNAARQYALFGAAARDGAVA